MFYIKGNFYIKICNTAMRVVEYIGSKSIFSYAPKCQVEK